MSELSRSPASPALLLAAFGMAMVAVIGAWIGAGTPRDPLAGLAPPVLERSLRFVPAEDDALIVVDTDSGAVVKTIAANEDTFIRGMLRGIDRERSVDGVAADVPLTLTAREDGSVTVIDQGTGIVYDLRAFGTTNLAEFARLLPPSPDRIADADAKAKRNLQTSARTTP
jgi:putative photosynthetic complex assembly protein